ncbi:MAG: NADH-quinone oxidoreductase subunit N, partial [Solirubrobacteraceae bacterium]
VGASGIFFNGFVQVDGLAGFFRVIFLVLAIFGVAVAPSYLARSAILPAEYYATICFSTLGSMAIVLSTDLILLFVGIELMTIPVYVLAGIQRRDQYSNEAALKYFLLGAFSSALLLYGFAWLYGIGGSTEFAAIAAAVGREGLSGTVVVAAALVTVGLAFKAAVIPFHQWTPDAYDGAPTPATAFISVAPKAAAFAAMLRLMVEGLGPLSVDWSTLFAVLAVITMTGGNVVALAQTNVKRMLAYSSIAHTGYILAGVAAIAAGASATAGVLFYLLAYGLMNLGAFACLVYLDLDGTRGASLRELDGLWARTGIGALAFTVFLVSLTGIPPTMGFVAKVLIIEPVLDAGLVWLAVAIALNAVLAAFYYLRVVVHLYMQDPQPGAPRIVSAPLLSFSLGLSALAVVVLGVVPDVVYAWALEAAAPLVVP